MPTRQPSTGPLTQQELEEIQQRLAGLKTYADIAPDDKRDFRAMLSVKAGNLLTIDLPRCITEIERLQKIVAAIEPRECVYCPSVATTTIQSISDGELAVCEDHRPTPPDSDPAPIPGYSWTKRGFGGGKPPNA